MISPSFETQTSSRGVHVPIAGLCDRSGSDDSNFVSSFWEAHVNRATIGRRLPATALALAHSFGEHSLLRRSR